MAEFDVWSLLPVLVAVILPFLLLGIKKIGQTSEGTLSGTIKLEIVDKRVNNLEKGVSDINKNLNTIIRNQDKNTWRIEALERKTGIRNGNGSPHP